MAERKIIATTVLLMLDSANTGSTYDIIICLTSFTFKRSTTQTTSTTFCGPGSSPGEQTVGIDFAGEIMLEPNANRISEGGINDLWASKQLIAWKIAPADPVAGDDIYSGTGAYISDLTAVYDTGNSTFTGSIGVNGLPAHDTES